MKTKIILLFLLITLPLSAQILEPVKWDITEQKVDESTLELHFKATIEEGWHLYSNELPDGGPLATEVTYTTLEGVEPSGELISDKKSVEEYVELFSMVLNFFEKEVTFVQRLKILSPDYKIEGAIRYMGCNNLTCLTPTTEEFKFASL